MAEKNPSDLTIYRAYIHNLKQKLCFKCYLFYVSICLTIEVLPFELCLLSFTNSLSSLLFQHFLQDSMCDYVDSDDPAHSAHLGRVSLRCLSEDALDP